MLSSVESTTAGDKVDSDGGAASSYISSGNGPLSSSRTWKLLQARSTSFPHTRTTTTTTKGRNYNDNGLLQSSVATVGRAQGQQMMLGAWGFNSSAAGATATTSSRATRTPYGIPSFHAKSSSLSPSQHSPSPSRTFAQRPNVRRTTPVLTLALLKLEKNLDGFCQHLKDPTFENVQKACGILDSSVPVTTPTLTMMTNSHKQNHKESAKTTASTSPSLSPLTAWFTGASNTAPISAAAALEGEWEKFSNPLIVFAGLEGIYASLLHAESSELARSLSKLYERTMDDLIIVRETLCTPFLPSLSSTGDDKEVSSTIASAVTVEEKSAGGQKSLVSYREKAGRVAASLDAIWNICHCRRKIIWQQRELWSSSSSSSTKESIDFLGEACETFQSLLPLARSVDTAGHATPILTALCQEVEAWYHLMEMSLAMEQLRFMQAIVNGQKTKQRLDTSSTTCIQIWLVRLFQSTLSILPMIFNQAVSSTNAIYGFDKSSFEHPSVNRLGPLEDLESKVGAILRMEEKNGVTAVVSIVWDGSRSRNRSIATLQRGFSLQSEAIAKTITASSTMESDSSSFPVLYLQGTTQPSSPRLLRIRRAGSMTKNGPTGEEKDAFNESKPVEDKRSPDNDRWPHTSWSSVVSLLADDEASIGQFVSGTWDWSQADAETLFHSTPINRNMRFVVLIKATEESQWSRRRPTTVLDEEAQVELLEIINSLRFSDVLKRAHVLEIRRGRVERGSSFSTETGGEMLLGTSVGGHSNFVQLLQSFKEELGLRSPRNKESMDRSFRFGMMSGMIGRSPGNPRRTVKRDAGHHSFFLGNDLMTAI